MAIYGAMLIVIGLFIPGGLARIAGCQRVITKLGLGTRIYWSPKS
jgi:hypothetical protein